MIHVFDQSVMSKPYKDPAFVKLHHYICMMIELGNYALTDKSKSVFELCKTALAEQVTNYPAAANVVKMYCAVVDPHQLPRSLCETNYTDDYVENINKILECIMLSETPEHMVQAFQKIDEI